MIKKITIQKIILKYYALNRTHVSRKFQTSNCHDKWTNNDFAARFDFAHRITKWRGDTFYKSKHVWTQIQFLGNIIRNVSSLEQNINDRPKKVNNKHTRCIQCIHKCCIQCIYCIQKYMRHFNNSISRNEFVTNLKKFLLF